MRRRGSGLGLLNPTDNSHLTQQSTHDYIQASVGNERIYVTKSSMVLTDRLSMGGFTEGYRSIPIFDC